MKILALTIITVLSTTAFAKSHTACGLPGTLPELHQLVKTGKAKALFSVAVQRDGTSPVEDEMLLEFANEAGYDEYQAVLDMNEGGAIEYYVINHKIHAVLLLNAEDDNLGAIFTMSRVRHGSYEMVALVKDDDITCHLW